VGSRLLCSIGSRLIFSGLTLVARPMAAHLLAARLLAARLLAARLLAIRLLATRLLATRLLAARCLAAHCRVSGSRRGLNSQVLQSAGHFWQYAAVPGGQDNGYQPPCLVQYTGGGRISSGLLGMLETEPLSERPERVRRSHSRRARDERGQGSRGAGDTGQRRWFGYMPGTRWGHGNCLGMEPRGNKR
jgi:hypothetical protein